MARVVDKEQKRRDIAEASKELLLEKGIKNINVADIAKAAGVGKGTIYEYFDNKEDIVFEIMCSFLDEYKREVDAFLQSDISTKEKLYRFLYGKFERFNLRQVNIFLEFTAILLTSQDEKFKKQYKVVKETFAQTLNRIFENAIVQGEYIDEAIDYIDVVQAFNLNLVKDYVVADIDIKSKIDNFVELTDKLLRRKK